MRPERGEFNRGNLFIVSSSGEEVKDDFVVVVVSTFENVTTSNAFREDFAGDSNAFTTVRENNDAKTNKRREKTEEESFLLPHRRRRILSSIKKKVLRASPLLSLSLRSLCFARSYEEYCVCVLLLYSCTKNKYV